MKKKLSIFELAEKFTAMESRHDLFAKETPDGVKYWDALRYGIYLTILFKYGFVEDSYFSVPRISLQKKLIKSAYLLFRALLNDFNLFLSSKKKYAYIFLSISRFEDKSGNPADFVLKDIYDQLQKDSFCIEFFRHKSFGFFKRNTKGRYFTYKLELMNLISKPRKSDWSYITNVINAEYDLDINWGDVFDYKILEYKNEYKFFKKIFKRIKPKYLFFQSLPKGMIAAANDLNIITIDVLHGYTNNLGMFYGYSKSAPPKQVKTLPQKLFTFSEYSSSIIDFPVEKVVVGNSYFFEQKSICESAKSAIMIVSGFFIHDYLSAATYSLAVAHPDVTFYYKLHSNQGQQELECRRHFSPLSNVAVIYTEKNVNEIMDDCFAIIVIQSTVTYQALQKGLKVFIFKKDYYEISYDVFNEPGVFLVDNWKELSTLLSNKDLQGNTVSKTMFFEPFNKNVLEEVINF